MTSVAFDIPIIRDNIHERNESFKLTVAKNLLPSGVNCGYRCMAYVIIVDTSCECFIGASLSEPHHRRSTVKSVFLLACLLACLLDTSSLIRLSASLIWLSATSSLNGVLIVLINQYIFRF